MIYVFRTKSRGDILAIEADDEEVAIATLLDNKLIPSPEDAAIEAMGNIFRVRDRGLGMQVTGEEDLLMEELELPTGRGA